MDARKDTIVFKFLLLGDAGVGKTSLMRRFAEDTFNEEPGLRTIGVDFRVRCIRFRDKLLNIHVWEFAGRGGEQLLTHSFCRGSHGILIVFDVGNRDSLNRVKFWLEAVARCAPTTPLGNGIPLVLVGNKSDLAPHIRQVMSGEAARFALDHSMIYIETSAVDAHNVGAAFLALADALMLPLNSGSAPPRGRVLTQSLWGRMSTSVLSWVFGTSKRSST